MDSSTTLNDDAKVSVPEDLEENCKIPDDTHVIPVSGPIREFGFLPVPPYLRHTPGENIHFGLATTCLLSFCTIFLAANLGYAQPLLVEISRSFNVSLDEVSQLPTAVEVGYAIGVVFISPLGDTIRRRQLSLILVLTSASLSIGLAFTQSFVAFRILAFLLGLSTISPQIIITLARDHSHPSRKAIFYSIILAGYLSGILAARLLAGSIAHASSWRAIFYFACAAQTAILMLLYLFLPDIPEKNSHLKYGEILRTMATYVVTEPIVVQGMLVGVLLGIAVSAYLVTLTFQLGSPPYSYSTLKIGLFGLTDVPGILLSPCAGLLVDRIAPWRVLLLSAVILALFEAVQVAMGGRLLAALILRCVGVDILRQLQYIALSAFIYTVSVASASRLNALLVLAYYIGQIVGTSAGPKIFVDYGPRAAAGLGLACYVLQAIIILVRRPRT